MADSTAGEPAAKRLRCDPAVEDRAAQPPMHGRREDDDDCSSDSESEGERTAQNPINLDAVLARISEMAESANALYAKNVAEGIWLSVEEMKARGRQAAAEKRSLLQQHNTI